MHRADDDRVEVVYSVNMEIILIGDDRVKKVSVRESGEQFVDFTIEFPSLLFDLERRHVQKKSESISFGRREVGLRLLQAQSLLPEGIKLLIKECYRPLWIQREFFEGYSNHLRSKFPELSDSQVYVECSKLNAPVDVAPHSTGGAVDLTLVNERGHWLEMGTEFNAEPSETKEATYTSAANISETARVNRSILIDVMTSVGFQNYPTEWWHWSYGDKYWALIGGHEHAIYSSIEDLPAALRDQQQ